MFLKAIISNKSNSYFLHIREECLGRIRLLELIRLATCVLEIIFIKQFTEINQMFHYYLGERNA